MKPAGKILDQDATESEPHRLPLHRCGAIPLSHSSWRNPSPTVGKLLLLYCRRDFGSPDPLRGDCNSANLVTQPRERTSQ